MAIDWQSLVFLESDFVHLRGVFAKERRPLPLQALLSSFVQYRLQAGDEESGVIAYHPYDRYVVGQTVYFPAYDEREVIREIEPCIFLGEKCETIVYRSKKGKATRTFIAGASEYFDRLPRPPRPEREATSLEQIVQQHGLAIKARLGAILASNRAFVRFRDWWVLRDLLVPVDPKPASALVYEYGCIDSTSLAYSCLGDLDLARPEDQVKLFSLCYKLGSDRRLWYDPVRDWWRVPRLFGIQSRTLGRAEDDRKVLLHPAPIYPDTPSALKQIRNVEEGEMWTFQDFQERDRCVLGAYGEDTFQAPEFEHEEWAAQRPKSVSFRLSAANVLDGFLPFHVEARKLFPERTGHVVMADDFGVRFDVVVDPANRLIYNTDGLLADYFAAHRLEPGCEVHIEHLDSESNYHIHFQREGTGTVPGIVMGFDEGNHAASYRFEPIEPAANAQAVFRVELSKDDVLSLREVSISQEKNTFDLLCEELPRLAQVVSEGRVTLEQLFDAIYVRRPCQMTVLLGELRRHPCFVEQEEGVWSFVPDGSLEPRPPVLQWEPALLQGEPAGEAAPETSGEPVAVESSEQEPDAAPATGGAEATEATEATQATEAAPAAQATATAAPPKPKAPAKRKRKIEAPPWVTPELAAEIGRFVENHRESYEVDPDECVNPAVFDEFLVAAYSSRRYQRFATPREVAAFMAELADPEPGQRVVDACCGTGGLLLAVMNVLARKLRAGARVADKAGHLIELPPAEEGDAEPERMIVTDEDELLEAVSAICAPQVAGMDVVPMAIEGSRLNLAVHGYSGAQLLVYDAMESRDIIPDPTFDVVLGYPPPGEFVEENFYSRYWELAKPGGRVVTLIPPTVLASPERADLRAWFTTYFAIDAIVTLPRPKKRDLYGPPACLLSMRKLYEGMDTGEALVAQVNKYSELHAVLEAARAQNAPAPPQREDSIGKGTPDTERSTPDPVD